MFRTSKVDCVEVIDSNSEINDTCSQVVLILLAMAIMVTMTIVMTMTMAMMRLSVTKSFSQVSECPTKDCHNDMEMPPSESSSQGLSLMDQTVKSHL